MLPNLTIRARLDVNPSHFLHGRGKLSKEVANRPLEQLLNVGFCDGVCGQSGVRLEKSPSLEQEGVVAEVKGLSATGVHLYFRCVIGRSFALVRLEICSIFSVQSRVLVTHTGEIVEPV